MSVKILVLLSVHKDLEEFKKKTLKVVETTNVKFEDENILKLCRYSFLQANPFCESSELFQEAEEGGEKRFCIIESWSNEEECDKDCNADYVKEYIKEIQDSATITLKKLKPV